MVLASNEWLSFCEDDQKSDNNTATTNVNTTTTTATTTTTTQAAANTSENTEETATTSTSNTNPIASSDSSITTTTTITNTTPNSITKRATNTTTPPTGEITDNANNEAFLEYQQNKPPPPTYEALLLNSKNLNIMADSTNAFIKNEFQNDTTTTTAGANNAITTATVNTTDVTASADTNIPLNADDAAATPVVTTAPSNESENNNQFQNENTFLNETLNSNNTLLSSSTAATATTKNSNNTNVNDDYCNNSTNANNATNANSNSNSNTNTLQPNAQQRQNNKLNAQHQQQQQLPRNPITPQALSSALQSVMNATAAAGGGGGGVVGENNRSTLATSGTMAPVLPDNFLSALGMGLSMSALQQSAKQLTASFCIPTTINDSNLAATNVTTATPLSATTTATSAAALDSNNLTEHELNNSNGQAKIILLCEPNSHPFQTRTILLMPNIECKVGRLIAKSKAAESNAIFDCKVLSRNHAVLWYTDDGKFWVKDTKSSNGTFINENKLGTEAAELHFGDIVKFGVDVLENSRKEVHGCIIACVKLYLPDGREAISIDVHSQRSQYSGEGRVSFDELHRLNLYMQEASQREKVLKSKLFNIQNVLDATRKNSALCWQSMIAEDQLLHRINSLEKKLQIMEKNVPESVLRNEVLKLLDDKSTYQHTAKEALRKVYQERCDAMQMLTKMESAYTTSDNECKILRDQIMCTKQSLQDVNTRLLRLESEYNDYKDECERQKQEAKEQEQQHTAKLTEKLKQYEMECEQLRRKIAELLLKRAEQLDAELEGKHAAANADIEAAEQAKLERQAIEKLDAAIADMDLGDDDDDDEEDDDDDNDNNAVEEHEESRTRMETDSGMVNGIKKVQISSIGDGEQEKTVSPFNKEFGKNKVVKESTILKWLQNSDLNKGECSLDIFKAICNESDSGDEYETSPIGAGTNSIKSDQNTINISNAEVFEQKCTKFTSKLQSVQKNLKQLEAEIESETNKAEQAIAGLDDGSQLLGNDSDDEFSGEIDEPADEFVKKQIVGGGKASNSLLSKENKNYLLLKHSVSILREAYNEICNNIQQQNKELTSPPAISVQTQFQAAYTPQSSGSSAVKKFETQSTLKPLPEVNSDEEEQEVVVTGIDNDNDDDDDDDDISDATSSAPLSASSQLTIRETDIQRAQNRDVRQELEQRLTIYEQQVQDLQEKLELNENDAQNTLEIMQIECDAFKDKVNELAKLVETLRDEKNILQLKLNDHVTCTSNNSSSSSSNNSNCNSAAKTVDSNNRSTTGSDIACDETNSVAAFDQQMREELEIINSNAMQREEELIMYKERLEQTQNENLQLRNEIAELEQKANDYAQLMLKRMMPYGLAAVAILISFLLTYY